MENASASDFEWVQPAGKCSINSQTKDVKEGNGFFIKSCQRVRFTPDGKHLIGYGWVNKA